MKAICHCGEEMKHGGTVRTLVYYSSPPGHDHDDNCRSRIYTCPNGHESYFSARNRCPSCDWVGKKSCLGHHGEKVEYWPGEEPTNPAEKV